MASYLLDTNHLGAALDKISQVRERLLQAQQSGKKIGTIVPVLCELQIGIKISKHRERNQRVLDQLLSKIKVWPLTRKIADVYADIFLELRKKGRILSQVDMLLAALARLSNFTILTTDKDFGALSDIAVEDWL